ATIPSRRPWSEYACRPPRRAPWCRGQYSAGSSWGWCPFMGWRIARHGLVLLATVLLGALLSAVLVRLAPGFDVDEQQLDPHLSAESIRALRATRMKQRNILRFYFQSLNRAAHGDLGTS